MTTEPRARATGWDIRPYQPADEAAVLELFSAGGWAPRSPDLFQWRLFSRPAAAPTFWVAESGGRIAGTYGGTPFVLQLDGESMPAIHGSDAMTDPAFRRQGILTATAGAACRAWATAGYRAQIGVVWGSWGSRREALGWVPLFRLIWVRRWLAPERALARRAGLPAPVRRAAARLRPWDRLRSDPLRRPPAAGVNVRLLNAPDATLDRLWETVRRDWAHLVVRDRDWVAWRYFAAPILNYHVLLAERAGEPAGYLVYRIEESPGGSVRGRVADLFTRPADSSARLGLIRTALQAFRSAGAEQAVALVIQGSPTHRDLTGAGFRDGYADDFSIMPLAGDLPLDALRDPGGWHLMGGDFDVC